VSITTNVVISASPGTPIPPINKTDRQDITEIFFESGVKHHSTPYTTGTKIVIKILDVGQNVLF
jgi:hypothetical protein